MKKLFLTACLAACVTAGAASASTVYLGTSDSTITPGSSMGSFDNGEGLSGTILGTYNNDTDYGSDYDSCYSSSSPGLTKTSNGIGYCSNKDDNSELDGLDNDETITFTFDVLTTLLGIHFYGIGSNDDWDISFDGGTWYTSGAASASFFGGNGIDVKFFSIRANGSDDEYRIKSFSGVAVVPLPATALLLLGGIAGLGAIARQRKAA
jgi:hypothetical protein